MESVSSSCSTPASSSNSFSAPSEVEDDEVPVVTVPLDCGFTVDETYECPLKTESRHTITAAHESATRGCPSCILRCLAIKQFASELSSSAEIEGSHDYIFLPFRVQGQRIVLARGDEVKKIPNDTDDYSPQICNFYDDHLGGIELIERIVPCNTSSPETLSTVQKWIKQCDQEHDCMQNRSTRLPRRLLDIQANNIKLIESSSIATEVRYVCLSHRWGSSPQQMLCTTRSNFSSFKHHIPWIDLTRTFQDAVSFTRKLGLAYLWIDSLCIIQNEPDKRDWHEQSGDMANIYRNAYVTLAASASDGPNGGCYTSENGASVHRVGDPVAVVKYADGMESELFARRKFDHKSIQFPLLKRGWVYQERMLSARMLHFVGEEVVWECGRLLECECGADDYETGFERGNVFDQDDESSNVGPTSRHPPHLRPWVKVVSDYTALSLSNVSDKLPALSGIAQVFAARLQDEYAAGLWRKTLVPGLLWYYRTQSSISTTDPLEWRAPSWSWASANEKSDMRFLPVSDQELATVKEVTCQPSGADPTGELSSAHLILSAKTMTAHLEFRPDSADEYIIRLDHHDFIIPKTANDNFIETGYLDLTPLPTANTNILLVQLTSSTFDLLLYLHNIYPSIPYTQTIRTYLVLAQHNQKWSRIGLASIAEYNTQTTPYSALPQPHSSQKKEDYIQATTPEQITQTLESHASLPRSLFHLSDTSQHQDILIH
jgi:hypothetical protein